MRIYFRETWSKLYDKVKSGSIAIDKVQELFAFYYGVQDNIYSFDQDKLVIYKIPLELD